MVHNFLRGRSMIIEDSKQMGRGLLVYVMLELTVPASTRVYAQAAGASLAAR